jgi:hypothetical protein
VHRFFLLAMGAFTAIVFAAAAALVGACISLGALTLLGCL